MREELVSPPPPTISAQRDLPERVSMEKSCLGNYIHSPKTILRMVANSGLGCHLTTESFVYARLYRFSIMLPVDLLRKRERARCRQVPLELSYIHLGTFTTYRKYCS
jgi:hypothetical protein